MVKTIRMKSALQKAVEHFEDNQTELSRRLGVSQQRIWNWIHRGNKVPAEFAILIEKVTEGAVTRRDLRPDLPWDEL